MRSGLVKNSTRYSGVMLRAVLLAVVSDVEGVLRRDRGSLVSFRADNIRRGCHITCVYTRRGGCSGWASLSGGSMRLRIQRDSVSTVELIWLIRHEVYHLFGVDHAGMPDAVNNRSTAAFNTIRERFAEQIARYGDSVSEVPVPAKTKPSTEDKRIAKLASIEARLARWVSKQRRAENAIKKLTRQKSYYLDVVEKAAAKGPRP